MKLVSHLGRSFFCTMLFKVYQNLEMQRVPSRVSIFRWGELAREMEESAESHTDFKWQSWDLNTGSLIKNAEFQFVGITAGAYAVPSGEPVWAKHGLSTFQGLTLPSQRHSESINRDLFKGGVGGCQNRLVPEYH